MKLTQIDTCLPDYFSGYHKPVLQVPVHKGITKAELTQEIINEYNMSFDYLTPDWPDLTDETLQALCNAFILTEQPLINSDIPRIGDYFEDDDSVYLFIILED